MIDYRKELRQRIREVAENEVTHKIGGLSEERSKKAAEEDNRREMASNRE